MWEYNTVAVYSVSHMQENLVESGKEGWELVQVLDAQMRLILIYKRLIKT